MGTHLQGYIKQVEIDFGETPIDVMDFTIIDTQVNTTSHVICQVAYVAPTDKDLDELEFDSFEFRTVPSSGSFTLHARSLEGLVADKFKINYAFNTALYSPV